MCEWSFGTDHMLIHARFLHPHHRTGILLLLLGLPAAGAAGLLTALLCLLLLGLLRPVGKHDIWLLLTSVSVWMVLMFSFISEHTFCSSFSSSLFLLLKYKNMSYLIILKKTPLILVVFFHLPSESDSSSLSSECFLFFLFLDFFFFFFFFFSSINNRLVNYTHSITVIYSLANTGGLLPSELNSELLFFSSSSTGVNSSELVETGKKI